ncbi:rod shape-determining protein MreD [Sphingomonas sp.]|uniref:rod shape-determining protein MreD n=1 Tax=Sphingomonas sp. TaxID=28214 RepID=UPI0035AF560B
MSPQDYKPFDPGLPPGRARALPWITVMAGSLVTILPAIAIFPVLPPFGLLMLLAWRLLARFALRPWAAAPLGAFDDLASGQPLGSAVLLWSATFLAIELIEQRLVFRDFWQDWLIAAGGIAFCLVMGRLIAVPLGAQVDTVLVAQIVMTIMLFPVAARTVAWIDRKRGREAA